MGTDIAAHTQGIAVVAAVVVVAAADLGTVDTAVDTVADTVADTAVDTAVDSTAGTVVRHTAAGHTVAGPVGVGAGAMVLRAAQAWKVGRAQTVE